MPRAGTYVQESPPDERTLRVPTPPATTTPSAQRLRTLLSQYAQVRIAQFERDTPANRRALDEATRALCAATGSPDIKAALFKADDLLAATCPQGRLPAHTAGARQTSRALLA
ncbi:DUF5133 domain-containing protein [Streptomyces sp. SID7982]|uniref:DUF5133 domain-containing protein n=1 Tax=Streptomyces rutgersensis TaxID=53451 RepID=A0ABX6RNG8_9ACTN|nr:DUF5133 domain-containing protein [Streptomyces sp. BRB081]NEE31802.1 DUF5133 domain-containing protein [Streptomyces sp. SID7982]NEE53262.1 DUF5133 domain-containing protein [Streptomyces sp. SID8455]QNE81816.1 DUF5133 domain-containing protein [Streptomyces rutgersensis]